MKQSQSKMKNNPDSNFGIFGPPNSPLIAERRRKTKTNIQAVANVQ